MLKHPGLYSLEHLDLTGCTSWLKALYWEGEEEKGIDWGSHWPKLSSLRVHSGFSLSPESEYWEVADYVENFRRQNDLERAVTAVSSSHNNYSVEIAYEVIGAK